LLVALLAFLALLPFCHRGLIGGADLKLLVALAMGLSPLSSATLLLDVTLSGGVLALAYLALHRLLPDSAMRTLPLGRANSLVRRVFCVELWRVRRHCPLPYGVAIAIGAVVAVINQPGVSAQ